MEPLNLKDHLKEIEKDYILKALQFCSYRKSKAADLLSVKRTTLIESMKRLGLGYLIGRPTTDLKVQLEQNKNPVPETGNKDADPPVCAANGVKTPSPTSKKKHLIQTDNPHVVPVATYLKWRGRSS